MSREMQSDGSILHPLGAEGALVTFMTRGTFGTGTKHWCQSGHLAKGSVVEGNRNSGVSVKGRG